MSMRNLSVLGSTVFLLASLSAQSGAVAHDQPEVQTPEQALSADLKTIAAANGWTLGEAETDHHAAETVGQVAGRIARSEPDRYVGSAVGPDPDSVPRLYLKGEASAFARGLVEKADIAIRTIDGQPYSFDELEGPSDTRPAGAAGAWHRRRLHLSGHHRWRTDPGADPTD